MPKLAHLKKGTEALQARLAVKPSAPSTALMNSASDRVGDRLEGAISRLMTETTSKANKALYTELANVVGLVRDSHNATHRTLLELAELQTTSQEQLTSILGDLKSSRPAPKSDDHLVARLEQIASDLGTVPRSFPKAKDVFVDLGPLTDLTHQVLAKIDTPKREHVFEIERDPFSDLITQVNVKEI